MINWFRKAVKDGLIELEDFKESDIKHESENFSATELVNAQIEVVNLEDYVSFSVNNFPYYCYDRQRDITAYYKEIEEENKRLKRQVKAMKHHRSIYMQENIELNLKLEEYRNGKKTLENL